MGEVVGDAGGGRNAPFTWFTAPDTSTAEQQAVLTVIHRNIYFNILLFNVKQTNKYMYNQEYFCVTPNKAVKSALIDFLSTNPLFRFS